MVDSPRDPATRDRPATPRWVKAFGVAAIIVAVIVIFVMLVGGGQHGPSRHTGSGDAANQTPTAIRSMTADGAGAQADPVETARMVAVTTNEPSHIDVGMLDQIRVP